MSIIPVICHNFLRNCSKRRNVSASSNFISKNREFVYSDKVISFNSFRDNFYTSKVSSNNIRGGVRF